MDVPTVFAQSIAEATRALNQRRSLNETLRMIAEVTRNSVPGFDQVGISTFDKRGKVVAKVAIGDLALGLDEIQYGLGEGPCVETLRGNDVVAAPWLRHEQRWSRYVPRAVTMGVRSQLALRLHVGDGDTLGAINLYSTTCDDVSQNAQALAALFAAHSAVALSHAQERTQLADAMASHQVIGRAVGILMERHQINADRAFALLVRASSHANVKLRTIAQELVDEYID
jgi:GAF domain-containing protein